MESIFQQEELIRRYLDEGNTEGAVKLIFELVTACAREKNFKAAESLRQRIFEIDPLALSEIIRSGEIIEQEMHQAIDKSHREIWSDLYDKLEVEEANALFFALKNRSCSAFETVYAQGENNPRLYFINSGTLKIVYVQGGRESLIKTLGRGDIAGEDTFFYSTMCTTSMVTQSPAELSCLDAEILRRWKTQHPVLESKLHEFALKSKKIKDLVLAASLDRRRYKRVQVGGRAEANLLSAARTPVGKPFKVDIVDISQGGVGFLVRITRRETASLLLGQKVHVKYVNPALGPSRPVERNGIIVAVRFHPLEDCSISVKFDEIIEEALIEEIARAVPPKPVHDF